MIAITQSEFRRRVLKDQEHRKRMKLLMEGHTDEEIAFVCKCHPDTIGDWRKRNGLLVNSVISGKSYKNKISNRKPLGKETQKSKFFH